ncbi:hypothetical protein NN561_008536 [Cricetulus griseus]
MGVSISYPIFVALNELLRSKGLKLKRSTLDNFLEQVDIIAPWFANTGQLTVPSWEKLGRDLDFAWEQGTLKPGVRSIWRLVRGCLEDKRCSEAVEQGQAALDSLQEERSEKANSEKKIYPSLKELEETESSSSKGDREDEEELQALIKQLERTKVKRIKGKREKPEFKRSLTLENERETPAETPSMLPPYNIWKEIMEAVAKEPHTALRLCMTPTDWTNLVHTCLSPGQYLEWKVFLSEFADEQVAANRVAGGPVAAWDKDMLLG